MRDLSTLEVINMVAALALRATVACVVVHQIMQAPWPAFWTVATVIFWSFRKIFK